LRDFTPEDKAGLFQGVRMVFNVLIPMIVGPQIGNAVCKYVGSGSYIDEGTGLTQAEPCAEMFLVAGIISLLVLIPLVILAKKGIDVVEE
jgi:MFS family permease